MQSDRSGPLVFVVVKAVEVLEILENSLHGTSRDDLFFLILSHSLLVVRSLMRLQLRLVLSKTGKWLAFLLIT